MDAFSLIDEEIRRLQQLRAMAEDPHMLALMRKFAGSDNSAPAQATPYTASVRSEPKRMERIANRGIGLTQGCMNAAMQLEGVFTIHEIKKHLEDNGVHIGAAKPMIAISGVLQRFVERGIIEVVEKGRAGLPSQYRRKDSLAQTEFPMSA